MSFLRAYSSLPPEAYRDQSYLDLENQNLFRTHWQWVGLTDQLAQPEGLQCEVADLPLVIKGEPDSMTVSTRSDFGQNIIPEAEAARCGRFVYVRLEPQGPDLKTFLGKYAAVIEHCSDGFDEVFHEEVEEWACNWKSGLEITLEGYHVPTVHGSVSATTKKNGSNFVGAIPKGTEPAYHAQHSTQSGIVGRKMREEMDNIARRLKIRKSDQFENYDHFTVFPNMTVGFSAGCLGFMQIYTPLGSNRMRLHYVYIVAKLANPAQKPVPLIKNTLLGKWREYTRTVLDEDKAACEMFQIGVEYASKGGIIGRKAEERVAHFHKFWRMAVLGQQQNNGKQHLKLSA